MSYWDDRHLNFGALVGLVIDNVIVSDSNIDFEVGDDVYRLYHEQDCCESVYVEDFCGDKEDLVDSPVQFARVDTNVNREPVYKGEESYTWTFYNIGTLKGSVNIRFYGSSNGYYSEGVSFVLVDGDKKANEYDPKQDFFE